MDKNEIGNYTKRIVHLGRPTTVSLEGRITHTDLEQTTTEVIHLCTPPTLNNGDRSIVTQLSSPDTPLSDALFARFPNQYRRLYILPWFPISDNEDQGHPLLANVLPHQLTQIELLRRCSDTYRPAFNVINHESMVPSLLREKYHLLFDDLIERLKVDMTLLDNNYTRLNQYMKTLAYEQRKVFHLRRCEIQRIDEKEYPLTLEFYLQFDINMFYMKTCSFRYARPRTLNEGLFCIQEPEARHELAACSNCGLCYPKYDRTHRSRKFVVEFSQAHRHIFVNGYQFILNCSASCHTRNIIYALTCPCGNVDYVGATTASLHDRLRNQRHPHFIGRLYHRKGKETYWLLFSTQ